MNEEKRAERESEMMADRLVEVINEATAGCEKVATSRCDGGYWVTVRSRVVCRIRPEPRGSIPTVCVGPFGSRGEVYFQPEAAAKAWLPVIAEVVVEDDEQLAKISAYQNKPGANNERDNSTASH